MTKKINAIFLIVLLTISFGYCVYAAPLVNYPCTITQPDGTEIECYLNGDEYFSYLSDFNGNIIVQDSDTGQYSYAEFTGGEFKPTMNFVDDTNDARDINVVDGVSISDIPETYIKNKIQQKKEERREESNVEILNFTENNNSTMGFNGKTLNNIVIFVEFNNTTFSSSHKYLSYYDGLFNSNDQSMKNYYNEISYGQTNVNTVFATPESNSKIIVYKSSKSRSYYDSDYDLLHELMDDAVEWATSNGYIPDKFNYDVDGDGIVDCVTFIFAGDVQNYGEYVFWPQAWWDGDISATIQGKSIEKYFMIPEKLLYNTSTGELFQKNEGILCHESFHAIFEGRDLYDDSLGKSWNSNYMVHKNAIPMRNWDLMSSSPGAHISSYMKYRYGNWITIPEIKKSGTYTLKPLKTDNNYLPSGSVNDTVSYVLRSPIPVSGTDDVSQYFIVEYRKYNGDFETDSNLHEEGLVVYRVNSNFDGCGNNCNNEDDNDSKYEIEEIYPKGSSLNLKYSNKKSSGISLSNVIKNSDGTLSFTVNMPTTKNLLYFNDARLADAVKNAIGKSANQITSSDIAALTTLNVSIDNAELPLDLSGMEYMTGLISFTAIGCKIDDITPLQNLSNLSCLDLTDNNIKEISALSNLSQLDTLKLRGNLIEDYTPTQNYYESITTKDFSLSNTDDFVFRIRNISISGIIGTVYITKGQYLPQGVYRTVELYNADGELKQKTKKYMSVLSSGSEISFAMPSGYVCGTDGSYIVLSLYEREDEKQLLSKITIKPSYFDLSSFN